MMLLKKVLYRESDKMREREKERERAKVKIQRTDKPRASQLFRRLGNQNII